MSLYNWKHFDMDSLKEEREKKKKAEEMLSYGKGPRLEIPKEEKEPSFTPSTFKDWTMPEREGFETEAPAKDEAQNANITIKRGEDGYRNREFEYDINNDPLFKQYLSQAKRNGQKAMTDTIAKSAAMTGGMAGSYAVSAGAGSYNEYMQGVNDIIPELEQIAYQRYQEKRWEDAELARIAQKNQNSGEPLTENEKLAWNAGGGWIEADGTLVSANGEKYERSDKYENEKLSKAYNAYDLYGPYKMSEEDFNTMRSSGKYLWNDSAGVFTDINGTPLRWGGTTPEETILGRYKAGEGLTPEEIARMEKLGYTYTNGMLYKNGEGFEIEYETPSASERPYLDMILKEYQDYGEEAIVDEEKAFIGRFGYSIVDGELINNKTGETYATKNKIQQEAYDKYVKGGWHNLTSSEQKTLKNMGYEYDESTGMISDGNMYYSWGEGTPVENVLKEYYVGEDVSYAKKLLEDNGYAFIGDILYDSDGNKVNVNYDDMWNEAMKNFQSQGYDALSDRDKDIIKYFGYYDSKKKWVYRDGKAYAVKEEDAPNSIKTN